MDKKKKRQTTSKGTRRRDTKRNTTKSVLAKRAKKLRDGGRSRRNRRTDANRPPRSARELFARTREFQDLWTRIVQVPAEIRAHGLTLPQAARQFGVSPKTVLRLAGSAFTKKRGRYEVKPVDRLLRVLPIPSRKGLREVETRDSREASLIGEYWNAVEKYLVRGDSSALKNLRRKYVRDATGRRVRLLMDLEELKRQGSAGVLRFEYLYGRAA